MQQVILASGSAQRKALLAILNVPFEIIPANIDEKGIRDQDFAIRAEKIARAKTEKVALTNKGIVIAGDTFTVCDNQILEKPANLEEAKLMLRQLSGNECINYSGFCYIDRQNNLDFSTTATAEVKFRELTDKEITEYVAKFPVLTWAAAYSPAYSYVMTMTSSIKGSFTGFTHGLPMELLIPLLRKSGIEPSP